MDALWTLYTSAQRSKRIQQLLVTETPCWAFGSSNECSYVRQLKEMLLHLTSYTPSTTSVNYVSLPQKTINVFPWTGGKEKKKPHLKTCTLKDLYKSHVRNSANERLHKTHIFVVHFLFMLHICTVCPFRNWATFIRRTQWTQTGKNLIFTWSYMDPTKSSEKQK